MTCASSASLRLTCCKDTLRLLLGYVQTPRAWPAGRPRREGRHPCSREGPVPWPQSVCVCGGVSVCEHVPHGHRQLQARHAWREREEGTHARAGAAAKSCAQTTQCDLWSVWHGHPDATAAAGERPSAPCAPGSRSRSCSQCGPALGPEGTARQGRASTDGPGKNALPLLWLPVLGSEHQHMGSAVNYVRLKGHEQSSPAGEVAPPLACPGLVPRPSSSPIPTLGP